ncbi:MAG: hypothetical protein JSS22_17880 [Proteobacteria bacterium]|nr:hypothetical protein [Pseudomonadota bacterium]
MGIDVELSPLMTFLTASVAEYCFRASVGVKVSISLGPSSFRAFNTFAMSGSAFAAGSGAGVETVVFSVLRKCGTAEQRKGGAGKKSELKSRSEHAKSPCGGGNLPPNESFLS